MATLTEVPGPTRWVLISGADAPTSVKTFPVEKTEVTSRPDLRIRTGSRNGSRKRKNDWNLAIWKVSSLFRATAHSNVSQELERYNIMVAAIPRTRWQVPNCSILVTVRFATVGAITVIFWYSFYEPYQG